MCRQTGRRELNVCIAYLMRASATVVFYLPVSALRITAMLLPLFLNGTNSATSSTSTSTFANSNSTAASILTTFKSREQGDMSQLWAENPDVWAETRSEYAQQLLGAGLLAHVFVIPVHCINFLLCWSRVPGFARNVRRLLALKPLEHYDIR